MTLRSIGLAAAGLILFSAEASAAEKSYDASDPFTEIKAARGVVVRVTAGETQAITALADDDDDDFSDLDIVIDDGRLTVRRKANFTSSESPDYEVRITAVTLDAIAATTGSTLETGPLALGDVALKADTGGSLQISGSCGALTANAATGGVLEAGGFACDAVTASASTGGAITARAASRVEASARLGGTVIVYGAPASVKKSTMLGGVVKIAD